MNNISIKYINWNMLGIYVSYVTEHQLRYLR